MRPPEGYSFDSGIGTTFTLDLYSLLIAPLSLAFLDFENPEIALQDPLLLLESLRRYSDRLTIFCQTGYIHLPARTNLLISFLEKMVVEVRPPRGGVFHSKFWLLRYTAKDEPPIYRLLNLTRNLTFDRSWDLMVNLEGQFDNRKKGFGRNRPIVDFLQALPGIAMQKLKPNTLQSLDQFQYEVMRVGFKVPEGFEGVDFYPIGIPKHLRFTFPDVIDRLLVISPFLSDPLLTEQTQQGNGHILVSRVDSLDQLSIKTRKRFKKILVLDDMLAQDLDESSDELNTDEQPGPTQTELSGLHAKLFVWESGWDAGWVVGSANATTAAFLRNVEFMVELTGKKSRIGIDTILDERAGHNSFMKLLRPYPAPEMKPPLDPERRKLEEMANLVRSWLIDNEPSIEVTHPKEMESYKLTLNFKHVNKPIKGNYEVFCWPITVDKTLQQAIDAISGHNRVHFNNISLTSLTTFFAFEVSAMIGKRKFTIQFVLNLPATGMPEEREDTVLSLILSDHSQFLRYLRLLLLDERTDGISDPALFSARLGKRISTWHQFDRPLLEEMAITLSRSSQPGGKIDQIDDLVKRLKRTPQGQSIIPAEFDSLWEVMLQAREKIQ